MWTAIFSLIYFEVLKLKYNLHAQSDLTICYAHFNWKEQKTKKLTKLFIENWVRKSHRIHKWFNPYLIWSFQLNSHVLERKSTFLSTYFCCYRSSLFIINNSFSLSRRLLFSFWQLFIFYLLSSWQKRAKTEWKKKPRYFHYCSLYSCYLIIENFSHPMPQCTAKSRAIILHFSTFFVNEKKKPFFIVSNLNKKER